VNKLRNHGWFSGVGRTVRTKAILSRLSLVVLPVLVLGLFLSSQALLKCDADGIARSACCCAVDMHGGDQSPGAHVSERCCCDSTIVGPVVPTSAVSPRASAPPATSVPVADVWSAAEPTRSASLAKLEVTRSAWPPNVPLYVLKSALLI
jgi:hypothetical protein